MGRATTGPNHVAFLSQVIDEVQATNKIDAAACSPSGSSAGAIKAQKLGGDLAG